MGQFIFGRENSCVSTIQNYEGKIWVSLQIVSSVLIASPWKFENKLDFLSFAVLKLH